MGMQEHWLGCDLLNVLQLLCRLKPKLRHHGLLFKVV